MRPYPGSCVYCGAEVYTDGKRVVTSTRFDGPLVTKEETWCSTRGCQAYHPQAHATQRDILTLGMPPPTWGVKQSTPTDSTPDTGRPLLHEASAEEKRVAGIALQHSQSVMDAWEKLEKKGYMLARRNKP